MFIENGMHQTQQSPRGATGDSGTREVLFNARTQGNRERGTRRGWLPQPIGRGNLAPTITSYCVVIRQAVHWSAAVFVHPSPMMGTVPASAANRRNA